MVVVVCLILLMVIVMAIFPALFTSINPMKPSISKRLSPPSWIGEDSKFLMGSDYLGRDVWSRIVHGARVSMIVGFVAVFISGTIGIIAGVVSGYFKGKVSDIIMMITDIQLSFPFLLLAVSLAAALGPGLKNCIIALGIGGWPGYCRIVRSEVLSIKERDYVRASLALGASHLRIILLDILPNVIPPVIVIATFSFSYVIVLEAALSFLGLGVQPPTQSWGIMISESRDYMAVAWWLVVFPGLALTLTVLSINLLGDWLRDRLDPKLTQL
jgi:peptide/nickel transport system permease protein